MNSSILYSARHTVIVTSGRRTISSLSSSLAIDNPPRAVAHTHTHKHVCSYMVSLFLCFAFVRTLTIITLDWNWLQILCTLYIYIYVCMKGGTALVPSVERAAISTSHFVCQFTTFLFLFGFSTAVVSFIIASIIDRKQSFSNLCSSCDAV